MVSFYPAARYGLIQSIRAIHALMDTPHEVLIHPDHAQKFTALRKQFGVRYVVTERRAPELDVIIDHSAPRTEIAGIQRPLIFSDSIFSHCRTLWEQDREISYSFAGLVTPRRREVLSAWMANSFPGSAAAFPTEPPRNTLLRRFATRLKGPSPRISRSTHGQVVLWSSSRGRHFPIKSWDEEYFRLLSRSRFVLCPNGDFVWSYRFFEAVLCGAIPVVEEACEAYQGFRYRTMKQVAAQMQWTAEEAIENFMLARERLTVPVEILASAVEEEIRHRR